MSGLTTLEEAARLRLEAFYNGAAYNPTSNAGGMAAGGHQVNFEPSLDDVALVMKGAARMALEVAASAVQTAADASNIAAIVGGTGGINLTPTGIPRIAVLGALAFLDQVAPLLLPIETTGALTISPHQVGAVIFSNGHPLTLPAFASCRDGWWCKTKNIHGSTAVSVAVVGADTIDGGAGPLSVTAGTAKEIYRAATGFRSI
ncbi:hypothetical protein D3874_02995 [Oleomonas cavernae]|uniref:Uncharacterized protein n=1 Tax=Oleomonas cavernae TaxID=2320859 RepID=A0A418WUC2_9PROT|nr:hypothetical protein [Oleomonas cavernae]RJF94797.1 hypothetical protein D3874_02995 [Oleomonas cavernae]